MLTKAQKQAARAAKLKEAKALMDAAEKSGVALTAEQTTQVETLTAEAKTLKGEIEAMDRADALRAEVNEEVGELDDVPAPKAATKARTSSVRDNREEDPKRGFNDFGAFGAAVARASQNPSAVDQRLLIGAAATGMNQTVGAEGGFLVPPAFSATIWDGMNTSPDNLLGRTDQYTIEGESLSFNANAETSRATGSRWGGVRGYWINEAGQIPSSKPTFRQVKIEPHQLAVLVYATDKLLKNANVALEQYLTRAAIEEILFLTGDSIINGTGVGQPKGILNSACRVTIAKESGQAANTIVKKNIDKMWARMHSKARANAVWFINQNIEVELENMTLPVGTGGVPVYMPAGGLADAPLARLKGRPVVPIEYCPTLGTEGDIILADMKAYASGTQGGVDAAMSMHLRFDYAESVFRFMFAVDGQPWLNSPITPFKGTDTLSPFVTLATRG